MEPTDLKNELPDDAQLEAWYRAHLATPPLRDGGFSQRVLAALPTPARSSVTQRRIFILLGILIGFGVALVGAVSSGNLSADLPALKLEFTNALTQLATPAVGWALGVTMLSLLIAFPLEWQRRLRF